VPRILPDASEATAIAFELRPTSIAPPGLLVDFLAEQIRSIPAIEHPRPAR
jgi:hypothetical protein